MTEQNGLVKSNPRFQIKKTGIAARLHAAEQAKPEPKAMPNRIGIVMDDSGSMSGEPISQAHKAIETFVNNSNSFDTSLALYPLNEREHPLNNDLCAIAIAAKGIPATGGTPLYSKLVQLINNEPITRAIAFSDGMPNGEPESKTECFRLYCERHIPIDTVYIGSGENRELQELAERTGGIYMHFTNLQAFAKSFKYLTPGYRAMLTDGSFREKVQRGEV